MRTKSRYSRQLTMRRISLETRPEIGVFFPKRLKPIYFPTLIACDSKIPIHLIKVRPLLFIPKTVARVNFPELLLVGIKIRLQIRRVMSFLVLQEISQVSGSIKTLDLTNLREKIGQIM